MINVDKTNDPSLTSWVESANNQDSDFPIQNLPFAVFSTLENEHRRVGVAIGDHVLDLAVLAEKNILDLDVDLVDRADINAFMDCGKECWDKTRCAISDLLVQDNAQLRDDTMLREQTLHPQSQVKLHLPIKIGDFTDFYASKEHATNVGSMFRDPKNALMPNWLHIPIGYNGRASTVVISGTDIRRPLGQIKPPNTDSPIFSPCKKLDIELEVGAIVGSSNQMGQPISVEQADSMIFGYVLVNDWSARDIQVWEYQPLGPFQAKAFATTISPWVVTKQAMQPFRVKGPTQEPIPLPYLRQNAAYNYDLNLNVTMQSENQQSATTISQTNFKYMYWSSAQQLAHHASSGCAMRAGDLLASGTISGPSKDSFGSLLELTWNGQQPIELNDGIKRTFIEDGDSLTLNGWCQGEGYRIGFGQASGTCLPALEQAEWPFTS